MQPTLGLLPAACGAPLWAVHIADGVLDPLWLCGGAGIALGLAWLGSRRIRDEEIPQVAVLTSAFFVASLVHVRIPPTSVHLLLNGLVGVVLGRRAALAIPVALLLQAALLGHGGFLVLGVNSCVMVLPALLAGLLFAGLRRLPWARHPWFRGVLVGASVLAWTLSLVYSAAVLLGNRLGQITYLDTSWADYLTFHPATLTLAAVLAVLAAVAEPWLEEGPEFAVGLLLGTATVLLTALFNCLVLLWGGAADWHTLALLTFVAHLPVAAVEGVVLGFTVSFLVRVKPEMLGRTAA